MDRYLSYEDWLIQVDLDVQSAADCSICDLTDVPLREWFEDGISYRLAADMALEYDGFY